MLAIVYADHEIIALGAHPKERRQDTRPSVNFKDGDVYQESSDCHDFTLKVH